MSPIVSIIVPVYNVENYLYDCINSILNQTLGDFELILVDDGSLDQSGSICEEYANRDSRIIVKHIKNNGVSNARNIGMKYATGVWLLFLDGDDILEVNTIEIINRNINENKDIDMLIGSFRYINNNNNNNIVNAVNKSCSKKGIEMVNDYGLWNIKTCMGSFAVKKVIVDKNSILFNKDTKYGEDVEFINYCLINSIRVKVTTEYFFKYIVHNQSAISKASFDRYDVYEARYRTLKYIQHKFPHYKEIELLYRDYLLPEAIIDTTYLLCRKGVNIFEIIKYLKQKQYYSVIRSVKDNDKTPVNLRNRINKFLKNPILTWGGCLLSTQYYSVRGNLGVIKRRVLK